jgi:hypothetical protein
MDTSTRQVQEDVELAAMLTEMERQSHPFREAPPTKRRYPGQIEGTYIAQLLNGGSNDRAENTGLLKSLRVIQSIAEAVQNHDVAAVGRLRKRGMKAAYAYLVDEATAAMKQRAFAVDIHDDGIVVHPTTPEGKAALAVLLLEKKELIRRVRKCLHCGAWFYALFKPQKFCSDPLRRCQWNHYHSPGWRKRNREANRKHQREFRKRIFGKRRA